MKEKKTLSNNEKKIAEISEKMASEFRNFDIRLFWPESFNEKDIDTEKLFKRMEREGKLKLEVNVYCSDGHNIWGGSLAESKKQRFPRCEVCGFYMEPEDVLFQLRGELTESFIAQIVKQAQNV